jgi:hypothetical protein
VAAGGVTLRNCSSGFGISPKSTEMSKEEERQMLGYSHEDIEARAREKGLTYRQAMVELSAQPKEAR